MPRDELDRRRTEFIERRKRLGLTQAGLAELVAVDTATVANWERGTYTPHPRYRPRLAAALQTSPNEIDRLLDPTAAPMSMNGHRVPIWVSHYDSLVLGAGKLAKVELKVVPALLQTRAYAECIERLGPSPASRDLIAERVAVRLRRQAVLDENREHGPLLLQVALDEGVLHDHLGSPTVMIEQLDHLVDAAGLPNVELCILPRNGTSMCVVSGFELLTAPGATEPFMACTFDVCAPRYHEGESDVARFLTMFEHLRDIALDPTESVHRIQGIRESYR